MWSVDVFPHDATVVDGLLALLAEEVQRLLTEWLATAVQASHPLGVQVRCPRTRSLRGRTRA